MGEFHAHVSNDSVIWRGVTWRNGLPNLNLSGVQLLNFCVSYSLSMTSFSNNWQSVSAPGTRTAKDEGWWSILQSCYWTLGCMYWTLGSTWWWVGSGLWGRRIPIPRRPGRPKWVVAVWWEDEPASTTQLFNSTFGRASTVIRWHWGIQDLNGPCSTPPLLRLLLLTSAVSGAGPGHNPCTQRWSGEPSSWRAHLYCRTLGTTQSYQRAKCFTTVEVNEPKTWVWEGFGEVM